jgi:hypothetical protein
MHREVYSDDRRVYLIKRGVYYLDRETYSRHRENYFIDRRAYKFSCPNCANDCLTGKNKGRSLFYQKRSPKALESCSRRFIN